MNTTTYTLAQNQPFAQSILWDLQAEYFHSAGPEAWARGQVPHYITSNPRIARNYADLVFAYFRDLHRQGHSRQPLTILELGAGSGKFAYNFLTALKALCADAPFPTPSYTYVLSDLPHANLEYWALHPRFQPFFDEGTLDIALLDAQQPEQVQLQLSGQTLQSRLLRGPLVLLANYFFDSIPQDLYRIQGYQMERCLASIHSQADPAQSSPAQILRAAHATYTYEPLHQAAYHNKELDSILESYAGQFADTHLLFPHTGLKLLQYLANAAQQGCLLISADKGEHHLDDLRDRGAPTITKHGSFSLQVNYHAIREFCRKRGGIPLATTQMHFDLDVHCMLFHKQAAEYTETQHAFRHSTDSFGPDDFFGVKKALEKQAPTMNFREITAAIKLSQNDPRLFSQLLPRIATLAPSLTDDQALSLLQTSIRVWKNHFPLSDNDVLAQSIGELLRTIGYPKEARHFLEIARQLRRGRPEEEFAYA